MNHTPTPWQLEQGNEHCKLFSATGPTGWKFIGEIQTGLACDTHYRNDAEFILRACNAHDELVDVLETCLAYVDCGSPRSESDMVEQSIRKALAKAKKVTQ